MGWVGTIFTGGAVPPPQSKPKQSEPPPEAPSTMTTAKKAEVSKKARRGATINSGVGSSSTALTGTSGLGGSATTQNKSLLGN